MFTFIVPVFITRYSYLTSKTNKEAWLEEVDFKLYIYYKTGTSWESRYIYELFMKTVKSIKRYKTCVESQELSDATSSWQPCLDSGKILCERPKRKRAQCKLYTRPGTHTCYLLMIAHNKDQSALTLTEPHVQRNHISGGQPVATHLVMQRRTVVQVVLSGVCVTKNLNMYKLNAEGYQISWHYQGFCVNRLCAIGCSTVHAKHFVWKSG